MSEQDPSIRLNMPDGKSMEANYRNTTLFTFLGKTAIGDLVFDNESANHVFIQTGRNEKDQPTGMYFFEKFHPVYADIAKFAIEHSFPANLNHRIVPACDLRAYMGEVERAEAQFHAQLEGVMPEDF